MNLKTKKNILLVLSIVFVLTGCTKYVKDKKLLTEGMLEYYKLLGFTCE